jgi:tetratricopeptide (TPR) repeat protein
MVKQRQVLFFISIALAASTLIAYEPVRLNGFISFDDSAYIVENDHVKSGLTPRNLMWAFTKIRAFNWHPLTWISHMLDCQIYGLNPMGHHLTSLLFHVINALLLFLVLNRMTGSMWPSVFVAALFALHPLHVESVAWAAERKDVLSAFFWILSMLAYVRYVERPNIARYLLIILAFCLGLMAKQMLVTLPFVLLLLDYWPLGRLGVKKRSFSGSNVAAISVRRCILEKVPLLILSAIAATIVYVVQQLTGTVRSFAEYPLTWRIENALVSYAVYIGKMFWPCHLAIFYPHPDGDLSAWQVTTAIFLLAIITLIAISKRKQCPYLIVGWLWYLGTLLPVIGLVQVGLQAYADRYTYIPLIGLFIAVAWGIPDVVCRLKYRKKILSLSAAVLLAVLGVMTWVQVGQWRSDIVLYKHAATVVRDNWWAHNNLGIAYYYKGELDKASEHFAEALRIRPTFQSALSGMGAVLLAKGELDKAIKYLRDALQFKPDSPGADVYVAQAHANLGVALAKKGMLDEAIEHYLEALRIRPDLYNVYRNLGTVLSQKGETAKAAEYFAEAVRLKPDYIIARAQLGYSLVKLGKIESAIENYQKILQYQSDNPEALNALAWIWATNEKVEFQNPIRAVEFAQKACELSNYEHPGVLDTLAAAYAAAGNFPEAVKTAEKAIKSAEDANDKKLAEEIGKRLELYKAGQPYHEK